MPSLLERLSSDDAEAVARAVEDAGKWLAAGTYVPADAAKVVRAIAGLRAHARVKVREAVAEAARHLPDDDYEELMTCLLADANSFVARAARRSYDERSRRERVERQVDGRARGVLQLRERIARTFDARALRMADEVCDRSLAQFIGQLLHEVHKVATPLQVALAEIGTEAKGAGDRARIAERADAAQRALHLLLGIADSARGHAAPMEPRFREENVRALVEEQVALLRARIGDERLARLRLDVTIDHAMTVDADRTLLAQALSNLLQNAVEAYRAAADGPIVVRVRADLRKARNVVAVTVEDDGVGIAEGDVERLGVPFASSKGTGRGLGFLNVRKVVQAAHGGVVEVKSAPGAGTRVTLSLPRKQPE